MHREQVRHRTTGGKSPADSHGVPQLGPGKRTLTEGVAVQLRAAAAGSGAGPAAAGAPAAPSLLEAAAGSGARPALETLFGHRPGTGGREQALPSGGAGRAMPDDVRGKMESAFGADFSQVRIHEGARAAALGALAYTQGTDIHFGPGAYQPHSSNGQELLGHELAHVVQQRAGRVQATTQAKGVGVNDDSALEREADEMGAKAARGEPVAGGPSSPGSAARGGASGAGHGAPVQRSRSARMIWRPTICRTARRSSITFECVAPGSWPTSSSACGTRITATTPNTSRSSTRSWSGTRA